MFEFWESFLDEEWQPWSQSLTFWCPESLVTDAWVIGFLEPTEEGRRMKEFGKKIGTLSEKNSYCSRFLISMTNGLDVKRNSPKKCMPHSQEKN